jgi:hypothetical protein
MGLSNLPWNKETREVWWVVVCNDKLLDATMVIFVITKTWQWGFTTGLAEEATKLVMDGA